MLPSIWVVKGPLDMMQNDFKPPPEICPVCGAAVPESARACPDCGADHATGWNEEATAGDGLDLPDREFDYDAYLKREFGEKRPGAAARKIWLVAIAAAVIFIVLLWLWKRLQGG
jgi:hypothetical protein